MAVLKNRAKMSTSTTGTGTITLGSAESGYQTFGDAGVANADVVRYVIEDGYDWEIGTGTYTATGTTLTRTVSESSNADAAITLTGSALVFVGATVEDILQPANNLSDLASASTARTNLGLGTAATTAATAYATAAQGTTADAALPKSGGALTGAVTTNSTFDGRDVSVDGSKLDGIETGATADQTGAQIKTAYQAEANAFTDAQFTKLAGIEASADVTDATNVTASGALMDSEVTNLAQVKAFSSADYATAAQGSTADAALPKSGGAMTGAITTNSTFDGRDVAADGTKLDYITVTQAVSLDQMEIDIAALANGMVYKGDWSAASGSFPGAGAAQTGWFYYVSGAGTVNGITFAIGDNIIATTDNASASTYSGNWSKHDQTDAVQSVVGLSGSITKSALLSALNVEDGADVTDATNVTSAGALMDSEVTNLAQVKAFSAADYATAAQGTLAANALPKSGGAMTGAITTNSTFDGRDVATDGAKLDGIASGATNTVTNATHTGEVTGSGALTIASNVVDADNLKVTGNGTTSQYLRSDGDGTFTWATPPNTTYSVGDGGLSQINFTSADHTKLNGIATSANNYSFPYTVSASESTSTVAQRNSSGYLFSSYFNGTGTFATSGAGSGMGNFTGTNGSDTYGRSYNAAAARTLLNVADGATNVTNNNQLTNGAGYTTNVGDITGVTAGSGITGGGTSGTVTVSHADTSTQASLTALTGAAVVSDIDLDTYGHVTNLATRNLTLANLGYTGATNANYITNNNQLTNGAGYTTNVGDITGVTAGTGLDGGGTSGTVTLSIESDLRGDVFYIGRDTNDYIGVETTQINFVLDGATDMRLENDGDLHVEGNVIAYSTTISDERLKTDIVKIDGALDKIAQLNGYTFTYIADGKKSAGVIAQEVQKVLPSAIIESKLPLKMGDDNETEYMTVQYDQLMGLMIEAIKELKAEVAELKGK